MHQSRDIEHLRGILIYSYNGEDVSEVYQWNERMTIEIAIVNLNNTWINVEEELLAIV